MYKQFCKITLGKQMSNSYAPCFIRTNFAVIKVIKRPADNTTSTTNGQTDATSRKTSTTNGQTNGLTSTTSEQASSTSG